MNDFEEINFSPVLLPRDFVELLLLDINGNNFDLYSFIKKHKDLASFVDFSMSDLRWREDRLVILNSMGWINFRNNISSQFVSYQINRKFSNEINNNVIADILIFEKKLSAHLIDGHSVGFLLGFYLKMSALKDSMDDKKSANFFLIRDETIDLLSYSLSKVIRIDWLLIILEHFHRFIGNDKLKQLLEEKTDYSSIYKLLNSEERRVMMSNMLSYAYSINNINSFYQDTV